MDDEGANAFRIDAEDTKGRHYLFPVLDIQPMKEDGLYAITVLLRDEVGFWEPPTADRDLLVALTWRVDEQSCPAGPRNDRRNYKGRSRCRSDALRLDTKKIYFRNLDSNRPGLFQSVPAADYGGTYPFSGDRKRFLEQATFGPTVAALTSGSRRIGLRTWLAEQFDAPYPSLNNPYPDIPLKSTNQNDVTLGCGPSDGSTFYRLCSRDYYSMNSIRYQYVSAIVACVFAATAIGAGRLGPSARASRDLGSHGVDRRAVVVGPPGFGGSWKYILDLQDSQREAGGRTGGSQVDPAVSRGVSLQQHRRASLRAAAYLPIPGSRRRGLGRCGQDRPLARLNR